MMTNRLIHRISLSAYCVGLLAFAVSFGACKKGPGEKNGNEPSASAHAPASTKVAKLGLDGVDTSKMTTREHRLWSGMVRELLAPCPTVAVSIAQCVQEKRACTSCALAARYVVGLVQSGRTKQDVRAMYRARFHPDEKKTIVVGDSPAIGPADAPVTVVEFADFECPACAQLSRPLAALQKASQGKVRLVFKHYPLKAHHPHAILAAQAAVAAQKQGQFWKLAHVMFDNQEKLTESDLLTYAKKVGLDAASFAADLKSPGVKQRVEQDMRQGDGLGLPGTPTVFVNGRSADIQALPEWIELEFALVGVTSPVKPSASSATREARSPNAAPSSSAAPSPSAAAKGPGQ